MCLQKIPTVLHMFFSSTYKNNIGNIPKGVALRLKRIFDSGKKFKKHNAEY